MSEKIPSIAVLDVGKTNKKLIVFDPDYRILLEQSDVIKETTDEDGFPCEDLHALNRWMQQSYEQALQLPGVEIKALNFSAYGASLVHIQNKGEVWGPLYNYLKPFKKEWRTHFEARHGEIRKISLETASPDLGALNSGMQLYRIFSFNPDYKFIVRHSLHLPQYLCWKFSGRAVSEISSIGCHTMLWDFNKHDYHDWVKEEKLTSYLAPLHKGERPVTPTGGRNGILYGSGLHDSSASLIPYLRMGGERFVVISTGTWSISFNPFNHEPLTESELDQDCLSYLTPFGDSVKASRFFIGQEHDLLLKQISDHFHKKPEVQNLKFNKLWFEPLQEIKNLSEYSSADEAYHRLMWSLMKKQKQSTDLCLGGTRVQKICVDGGFSRNDIFMQMMAHIYPDCDVYAAAVPQASAIGAAMILEGSWNPDPPAIGVVELRFIPKLKGL